MKWLMPTVTASTMIAQIMGGGQGQMSQWAVEIVRFSRGREQLLFLRSACRGLDLYHREAAQATSNHVPVAGTFTPSAAVGNVKWNVAPRPLFAVAHKWPPCDSTMERLMDNPMPLPWGLVVKNAEKI
jgi:hypothetical protein